MKGRRITDLKDAVVSCALVLLAGVAAVGLLGLILYPKFGVYSIGVALIFGFPSGIVIGIWLLSFAAKYPK